MITAPRLRIVPLRLDHWEAYRDLFCDPETGRYDENFPFTEEQARRELELSISLEPFQAEGWNEYAVESGEGGLLGTVTHCRHRREGEREVTRFGYHFLPHARGRGLATEAVAALLAELRRRGEPPPEAIIDEGNEPSRRLVERLGFRVDSAAGAEAKPGELLYGQPLPPT